MSELEPIGVGLRRVLARWGVERRLRIHGALQKWHTVVGDAIARIARPLRLEDDTLWVAVVNSTWLQELHFQQKVILERLNTLAGEQAFKHLRFVVRSQLPQAPQVVATPETPTHIPDTVQLTSSERAEIAEQLAGVEPPELRRALQLAREASLRYQKWRAQQGWRRCPGCDCYYDEPEPLCFICRKQAP